MQLNPQAPCLVFVDAKGVFALAIVALIGDERDGVHFLGDALCVRVALTRPLVRRRHQQHRPRRRVVGKHP